MAPKSEGRRGESKAEWKATDGEAKSGASGGGRRDKGGGKGNRDGTSWSHEGEDDGARRQKAQGKGGRKGGKAESAGGTGWDQSAGWNQGTKRVQNRGGYNDEEYYDGSYGYGGGGYAAAGYGFAPWQGEPQDWQPMPPQEQPAPPPAPAKSIWTEYVSPDGTPYYYNCKTGLTQWDRPAALDPPKPPPPVPEPAAEKFDGDSGKGRARPDDGEDRRRSGGGEGRGRGGDNRRGGDDGERQGRGGRGRKKDGGDRGAKDKGNKQEPSEFGPPGCNLFVFHLPDDWADDDLHEYFAPHGNVVSAKVMKELGTGRSRGFGFVSYEDRVSAATAIKKMQGYKILGKRLKVEFKKGEGESALEDGCLEPEVEEGGGNKKSYPDDERLIGYLRAISAKNVVQSLKENEGGADDGDGGDMDGEVDVGLDANDMGQDDDLNLGD